MPQEIKTISFGRVNCHLVRTDKGFILIDTGGPTFYDSDLAKMKGRLEGELDRLGCAPGNLQLVIITHGDHDHTWNGAYIRRKYKTKIAMHKGDASMVEDDEIRHRKFRYSFSMMMRMIIIFLSMPRLKKVFAQFEKFKPDFYMDEAFDLSPYGFNAKILHLPGHTKGSIGILTSEGEFFCGDIISNLKKPELFSFADDFNELHSSIARLKALQVTTVYPGHGEPFPMERFMKNHK